MCHSLFHTSLKFYLLVLIVNRTFSDCTESAKCTQSTQEFPLLISFTVKKKFFTAYDPKKVAENHVKVSDSNLYTQYSRYALSTLGTDGTLLNMTSFPAKCSIVLCNKPIREPL